MTASIKKVLHSFRTAQGGGIVGASLLVAISAFLVQTVAGMRMSAEDTNEFLVFWSLLFGLFGIVGGIHNETARAVSSARVHSHPQGRVLHGALILGVAAAVLVGVSIPLWEHRLVPSTAPFGALVIVAAIFIYTLQVVISGSLAGQESWGTYAGVMGAEAMSRLVLGLAALALTTSMLWLEIAVAVPVLAWIFLVITTRSGKEAFYSRIDVSLSQSMRHNLLAMVSSASSSALVAGFPVLLRLTSHDVPAAVLTGTIYAVSYTRSTIMIPLQAFQGMAITTFVKSGTYSLKPLAKMAGILAVLAVVGGVAAAWCGPWIMDVLFSGKFHVAAGTFAGLVVAAVSLAFLTLTGAGAIAASAHGGYTFGWLIALIVTFALLFLPFSLPVRTCASLTVGPLVGSMIHMYSIRWRAKGAH